MSEKLNVGILGYGTVGSGVVHILQTHTEKIRQVTGYNIQISKILVKDLTKKRKYDEGKFDVTNNPDDILEDKNIKIIIEVIGNVELSKKYIIKALKNKKHVVTANKDLIALHGNELISIAQENGCDLYFEASVAGGIPILRTIVDGLAADKIQKVMGIINGTTNFMLTKMKNEKLSYEDSLKLAQKLGFAESDPTNDVDGIDAARKLVILSRLALGADVKIEDVNISGIRQLTSKDMEIAEQLKYVIKLIGTAEENNGKINLRVGPVLVPNKHPLSGVNNENNAIFVKGAAVGETMFYGPGAGELPTATSVVSDIICVAKNIKLGVTGNLFNSYSHETKKATDEEIFSKSFFRLEVADKNGAFLKLTEIFTSEDIGYDKIIQEDKNKGDDICILGIITHSTNVAATKRAIAKINNESILKIKSHYEVIGE